MGAFGRINRVFGLIGLIAIVVTYSIINAWPKKYTGVGLKADSNEVAVEGITLCHEGFEIQ